MPNAIEPTAAQTNIPKFKKSVIAPVLVAYVGSANSAPGYGKALRNGPLRLSAILAEYPAALTLISIDQ
jgi:hypothetical protein